mmetsp:Transcript_8062/g.15621  ORF Transcript_8062/g.15621 Transcript_8062/m.15621 type:complete len:463 (-) Transcript_8062:293-1681(-)
MAQTGREQRVILAQVGTDHERTVKLRQAGDTGAEPARLAERRGIAEITVAQAVIDVVAAQAAHHLGQQVELLDGAVGRSQGADGLGAVISLDGLQAIGDVFQRGGPVDLLPGTALLDHRRGQARVAVQRFIAEAVAVGDPAFVDLFVLERNDAHDLVVLDLHDQVGTGGVMRADALAARQLPGAGAVAEGLARQSADRADVNHVARQLGVHGAADEGLDLAVFAAVGHAQFHDAGDLLAEANAAGAVDAAAHLFHRDQRADILVEDDALLFGVAALAATVADRQILQLALAALVADGAVQRVVDQQEFHDALLGLDRLVALGADDHALRDRGRAGGHGLGCLFHIHQAHAAVGRDAQLLVVAEVRDVGAGLFGRMHHHAAFLDRDLLTVEFDFNHDGVSLGAQVGATRGCLCSIRCTNSCLKCLIMARTGIAAASPRAQMVRPWMLSATELSRSRSSALPSP